MSLIKDGMKGKFFFIVLIFFGFVNCSPRDGGNVDVIKQENFDMYSAISEYITFVGRPPKDIEDLKNYLQYRLDELYYYKKVLELIKQKPINFKDQDSILIFDFNEEIFSISYLPKDAVFTKSIVPLEIHKIRDVLKKNKWYYLKNLHDSINSLNYFFEYPLHHGSTIDLIYSKHSGVFELEPQEDPILNLIYGNLLKNKQLNVILNKMDSVVIVGYVPYHSKVPPPRPLVDWFDSEWAGYFLEAESD